MIGRLARRPEALVLAGAAAAWLWMIAHAVTSPRLTCCTPSPTWTEDMLGWTAMVVAMMSPTTRTQMRDVAARSYRTRRVRAVLAYALGYAAWWLALGLVACTLRRVGVVRGAPVFALVGAAWMLVPARELWHRRCHRKLPLYPVGRRADASAFVHGAAHGAPCVLLCWPLMIACMLAGHSLLVMAACTALVVVEKRMRRLQRVPLVAGAVAIALLTLL